MSNKTKIKEMLAREMPMLEMTQSEPAACEEPSFLDRTRIVASHVGVVAMLATTLIGAAGLAEREGHRVAVALMPSYSMPASENANLPGSDERVRGGREEVRHTSASYGKLIQHTYISGSV